MGLFVPLDVDFQSDPKYIAAGIYGECLFNRSLALAKRTLSDGKVNVHQLAALCLGIPGKPSVHAAKLVEVGLWAEHPDGWVIRAWLKRNQSSAGVAEKQEQKKAAALLANHTRWHTGRDGKPSSECPHCDPNRIRSGIVGGQRSESIEVETEVETETESYPTSGLSDNDDLSEMRRAKSSSSLPPNTRLDLRRKIARFAAIELAKTAKNVGDVRAWIASTARGIMDERVDDLDKCIDLGYSVEASVALLCAKPIEPPSAGRYNFFTDPACPRCEGAVDGMYNAGNNTHLPCPCRRAEPYEATTLASVSALGGRRKGAAS